MGVTIYYFELVNKPTSDDDELAYADEIDQLEVKNHEELDDGTLTVKFINSFHLGKTKVKVRCLGVY